MEELKNLVASTKEANEEKKLDPDDIKTTILAELFHFYEEERYMNKMLDSNPTCKKINFYLKKSGNLKSLSFLIIIISFFEQTSHWCKIAQGENRFKVIFSFKF